jgi:hypothetical protein
VERLDHRGSGAGIDEDIGLAAYLDALAGPTRQQVSACVPSEVSRDRSRVLAPCEAEAHLQGLTAAYTGPAGRA